LSAASVLAITAVLLASPALAAEQRCTELGANCVCSEPLNTTNLSYAGSWYNPGDTTTKQCTTEVFGISDLTGSAITRTSNDLTASNDSLLLSRLPKRTSTLQYVVRSPNNYTGAIDIHHRQIDAPSRTWLDARIPGTVQAGARSEYISEARAAARVYVYISDDYEFTHMGACTNSKIGWADWISISHDYDPSIGRLGPPNMYNFGWEIDCASKGLPANCGHFKYDGPGGTNPVPDCCNWGPSFDGGPVLLTDWRGKWLRLEIVVSNRMGPGYRAQMFLKNVTDDLPERTVIDTNGPGNGPFGAWVPGPAGLTPSEITATGVFTPSVGFGFYRAGTCNGFLAYSHYLFAQWDTNSGQRIGPAYEVEGGSGQPSDTTPPAAPTGLRVL
jgi:hypothetical protein